LDARAVAAWDSVPQPRLAVRCEEGVRYRWGAITVTASSPVDSARILATLPLHRDGWASPGEADLALAQAMTRAIDDGHPYAQLGVSAWEADSGRVALGVTGHLGPRVTITGARVEGLKVTRPALARRALGRLTGLPYD